jgi:hypothetical protein
LSALKESNPVKLAQYAVSNKIDDEPTFPWWVPFTLKKQESIISAVNKCYWKRTHKFGIHLPHTVEEALQIDKESNNDLWERSLQKEMTNVIIAFKMIGKGVELPPRYQKIDCHVLFDIKNDNFQRKSRMVAGGHMTVTPPMMTYASVVS